MLPTQNPPQFMDRNNRLAIDFIFGYLVPEQQQQQRQQDEQQLAGSTRSVMNLDNIPIRYTPEKPQSEWRKDFFIPEYPSVPGLSKSDYPQIFSRPIDYDHRILATLPDSRPAETAENIALNRRQVLVQVPGKEDAVTLESKKRKKKSPKRPNSIQIIFLPGLAFLNSGKDGCTLREIYAFVMFHFEGYPVTESELWKKTIRSSLVTHTDCYVKGQWDGFWQFSDKELFLEMLDAYCEHRSVDSLGLKNPVMWSYIREGKVGLAPVVAYPRANRAASPTGKKSAAIRRRAKLERKQEPLQHNYEPYPNYLNTKTPLQDPEDKPYVPQPFVDYYPAFPTYKPTPQEKSPREDDLFGHLVPPPYMRAAQLPQQVPQMKATYEWNDLQFDYRPLG